MDPTPISNIELDSWRKEASRLISVDISCRVLERLIARIDRAEHELDPLIEALKVIASGSDGYMAGYYAARPVAQDALTAAGIEWEDK